MLFSVMCASADPFDPRLQYIVVVCWNLKLWGVTVNIVCVTVGVTLVAWCIARGVGGVFGGCDVVGGVWCGAW